MIRGLSDHFGLVFLTIAHSSFTDVVVPFQQHFLVLEGHSFYELFSDSSCSFVNAVYVSRVVHNCAAGWLRQCKSVRRSSGCFIPLIKLS